MGCYLSLSAVKFAKCLWLYETNIFIFYRGGWFYTSNSEDVKKDFYTSVYAFT